MEQVAMFQSASQLRALLQGCLLLLLLWNLLFCARWVALHVERLGTWERDPAVLWESRADELTIEIAATVVVIEPTGAETEIGEIHRLVGAAELEEVAWIEPWVWPQLHNASSVSPIPPSMPWNSSDRPSPASHPVRIAWFKRWLAD